jgi:hypothetical protein
MSLFRTRPIFEDRQIAQYPNNTINLSGDTNITETGNVRFQRGAIPGLVWTAIDVDGSGYWGAISGVSFSFSGSCLTPFYTNYIIPCTTGATLYVDGSVDVDLDLTINGQLFYPNGSSDNYVLTSLSGGVGVWQDVCGLINNCSVILNIQNDLFILSGKTDLNTNNINSLSGVVNTIISNITTLSGEVLTNRNNITSLSGNINTINNILPNKLDLSGITINGQQGITVSGSSPNFIIGYSGVSNNFFTTGTTLSGTVLSFDRNDLSNAYSVDLSPLVFTGNTFNCNDLNNCDIITGITSNILSLSGNINTINNILPNKLDLSGITITGVNDITVSGASPNFIIGYTGNTFDCNDLNNCDIITGITSNILSLSGEVLTNKNNIISLSGNINTINNILPNKLNISGITISGQQGITVSGSSPNFIIGYSGSTFDCNDLNNCDIITGITSSIISLSGEVATVKGNVDINRNNIISLSGNILTLSANTFDCNDLNNCDIITGITSSIISLSGEVATNKGNININRDNIISLSGNILTLSANTFDCNDLNNCDIITGITSNIISLSGEVATVKGNVDINRNNIISLSGNILTLSANTFDCNDLNNCDIITGITSNIISLSGEVATINNILPNKLDLSGITITGINGISVSGSSPNFIIGYSGGTGGSCDLTEEYFFYTGGTQDFNLSLTVDTIWVFLNGVYIPEVNYGITGTTLTITETIPENSEIVVRYCIGNNFNISGGTFDCNDLNNCDIITGITSNIISLSGEVATVKGNVDINRNNIISLSGIVMNISGGTGSTFVTITGVNGITVSGESPNFVIGYSGNTSGDCINDLHISNIYGCSAITVHSSTQFINTLASGNLSFSQGVSTTASGQASHAEGIFTKANGLTSHAEGIFTTANGQSSHAEGYETITNNLASHAEGYYSVANAAYSHAEGGYLDSLSIRSGGTANGQGSHAEGVLTVSIGPASHAEGWGSISSGISSHAEGYYSVANGHYSHAEGGFFNEIIGISGGTANGNGSHAEGISTIANGDFSHAEGFGCIANGDGSHAEGYNAIANGDGSHAEGFDTIANGDYSHAEGFDTIAIGDYSHTEGLGSASTGSSSHAEGYYSIANGDFSHTEGEGVVTNGRSSHAEGYYSVANGAYSHAEGGALGLTIGVGLINSGGTANGMGSHAEGILTISQGVASHAEGVLTISQGNYSHAQGWLTRANGVYSFSSGWGDSDTPVIAGGTASFNHSYVNLPNISGASANYSAILGGRNHNITTNSSYSSIIGGSGNSVIEHENTVIAGGANLSSKRANSLLSENLEFTENIYVPSGQTCGVATLSSGSIIVNTNKVTSNSLIFLTPQNSITGVVYISSRTAGVSFTIQSTQSDNSDIAWFIIQPST